MPISTLTIHGVFLRDNLNDAANISSMTEINGNYLITFSACGVKSWGVKHQDCSDKSGTWGRCEGGKRSGNGAAVTTSEAVSRFLRFPAHLGKDETKR